MMNTRIWNRALTAGAVATGILLLGAVPAHAQESSAGPGWQAWLGCWETSAQAAAPSDAPEERGMLCVVPTDQPEAVEVVSLADGAVESRSVIRADGAQHATEREGCTGWESASWSETGTRVYLRSEFTCEGGVERRSSGVMALAPNQDWVDVQAVSAGANSGVQVVRYRPIARPDDLPADLASALASRSLAEEASRMAAAARIGPQDVIEASRHLDPLALEAWLLERDQAFTVDARILTQFADAKVPTRVIDLLVALSYPEVFAVDNSTREAPVAGGGPRGPVWDPWYGPGYGYYPYGRRYGRGWYGGYPAVIVVRQPDGGGGNGGKAVKGGGYRKGNSDGGASAPTTRPSSGGSSARAGGGGSGGSSGGGRTAKPKD